MTKQEHHRQHARLSSRSALSVLSVALTGLLTINARPTAACVVPTGIVPGGDISMGTLDLDVLRVTLEKQPWDLSNPLIPTVAGCSGQLETPISMRNLLAIDTTAFSAASMFHPTQTALDIFGDKNKSDARRRCQPGPGADAESVLLFDMHLKVAIAYLVVYQGLKAMPFCRDQLVPLMEAGGYPLSLIEDGDPSTDTPWGLAKAYADEIDAYLIENDGWNADGSMSRDFNRVPFSDFDITDSEGNSWEKYVPRNTPYKFKKKKNWQPLMESDGRGHITTQEHVTPHIGATGRMYGFDSPEDEEHFSSREARRPTYKKRLYDDMSEQVLEETRLTATDGYKQAAISFFDSKFGSLVPLKVAYFLQPTTTKTALDFYLVTVQVQLAIYNGVILAWKEKMRYDAPRPPSVIKESLGDTMVETYAGPDVGVATIKASEWEPVIRTMPHSEYPSASACLCQVYADQVIHFLGGDQVDHPIQLGPFSFSSWSAIAQDCSDSRLWGGMHFQDAVGAGSELCGGGEMAVSIASSIDRLVDGDEAAAIFKQNPGELMVRHI